jgi:hypothetical protein
MKSSCLAAVLALGVLLPAGGCKQKPAAPPSASDIGAFDQEKFMQEMANSTSAGPKRIAGDCCYAVRNGDYGRAATDLQKIAADPGLTEAERQAVSDAQAQLKQIAGGKLK